MRIVLSKMSAILFLQREHKVIPAERHILHILNTFADKIDYFNMFTFVPHLRAISQYRMRVCVLKRVVCTSHLLGHTQVKIGLTLCLGMAFRCWISIYVHLLHQSGKHNGTPGERRETRYNINIIEKREQCYTNKLA